MFSEFLETCRLRYGEGDSNASIGEWICANTTLNRRPFSFANYPFQRQIADDLHPNLTVEKCSQIGLALALDTPVPTTAGWTTMGEVQVGDTLFDANGQPTAVTYVSPIWQDRDCYEITFDTGETIVADGSHRWPVSLHRWEPPTRRRTQDLVAPAWVGPRRILSIHQTSSVPTRCLTVDNDEHLFLVGLSRVPTCNTEVQIRKFFAMLTRNTAKNGIFTLPNTDMFKRIYSGRMAPILQADSIFNPPTEFKPVRRNDLIQIKDSFGYITGCSEGDATSITADFLFHDEYDLSPQDIIGLFPSRLQNSDMRIIQSFSTPSYLGVKINRALASSDRHEYLVKCDSCGHHQVPEFTHRFVVIPNLPDVEALTDLTITDIAGLDLDACYVKCERCSRRLDLGRADNREWVPMYPDRRYNRGYKVRPFSTGRLTPGYILDRLSKAKAQENIRGFFNTVLGDPFASSTNQLQRGDVEAVMAPTGNIPTIGRDRPVYLGIDVGLTCHICLITPSDSTIGYDFIFWDTCHPSQLEERVALLRSKYTIIQGLIDRFPYTPTADALRDATGGIVMPGQYRGGSALQRVRDENGDITHYSINRTHALDRVKTAVTDKLSVIAGYGPHRETIITHFGDMIREDRAEQEPEWIKTAGNDHFFHAAALALLAPRVNEDVYNSRGASSATTLIIQSSDWMQNTSNLGRRSPAQAAAARGGLL